MALGKMATTITLRGPMRWRTTCRSITRKTGGARRLKYVDAPVARGTWHTLRVEFNGRRIKVLHDGKPYIELEDDHIQGGGAVGVWTKADSVTAFDDFSYGTTQGN